MPIDLPVTAINDEATYTKKVICNCDLLWSLAHQFTYLRLSEKVGENEYELIDLFEARAKRIAATYARFYLETEDGGTPAKQGRYYWMALGAFASKTVACLLATWQLNAMYIAFKTIPRGLGQGNLWLFTDVAASHWFYNHFPENFQEGMMCEQQRDANKLEDPVRTITNELPWADTSIAKINYFRPSKDIIQGFKFVKKIEDEKNSSRRRVYQLEQLMAIAEHEQGAVLQPLIYENPDFAGWARAQRSKWIKWMSPTYELTFTHACEIDEDELKSVAPDSMVVENFQSRMDWIGRAADKFHELMHVRKNYMHTELSTMAGWVNTPDAAVVY